MQGLIVEYSYKGGLGMKKENRELFEKIFMPFVVLVALIFIPIGLLVLSYWANFKANRIEVDRTIDDARLISKC